MAKLLIVNQMDRFMAFERGELPLHETPGDARGYHLSPRWGWRFIVPVSSPAVGRMNYLARGVRWKVHRQPG
jgi:hypothetical protein